MTIGNAFVFHFIPNNPILTLTSCQLFHMLKFWWWTFSPKVLDPQVQAKLKKITGDIFHVDVSVYCLIGAISSSQWLIYFALTGLLWNNAPSDPSWLGEVFGWEGDLVISTRSNADQKYINRRAQQDCAKVFVAYWVNSLWFSDSIWRHRCGSSLVQVKACCLTAPSH